MVASKVALAGLVLAVVVSDVQGWTRKQSTSRHEVAPRQTSAACWVLPFFGAPSQAKVCRL